MVEKVQKAFNMSVDPAVRNPVQGVAGSTNVGNIGRTEKLVITPETKEMGKKHFGLSDEDYEKYGK